MSDLYLDLMKFAVSYLELGGRLVFWMPVVREDYKGEESLPKHPCLLLVANCEQVLSSHTSRRLLVMEKVEEESEVTDDDKLETIKMTSSEFREHFYKCNLPRRERKERLKKYGHLNLKGTKEEEENNEASDEAN